MSSHELATGAPPKASVAVVGPARHITDTKSEYSESWVYSEQFEREGVL